MKNLIPQEIIENKIFLIREKKVMLDMDLAKLYGVETRTLNQAVKRNLYRFPAEFMFQLSKDEFENLKSHFVISSWGGIRKSPYVFTEYGVAMLSSVLNSEKAIQVNIQIIKTFVRLREIIISNKELRQKIEGMEKKNEQRFKELYLLIQEYVKYYNQERQQWDLKKMTPVEYRNHLLERVR